MALSQLEPHLTQHDAVFLVEILTACIMERTQRKRVGRAHLTLLIKFDHELTWIYSRCLIACDDNATFSSM